MHSDAKKDRLETVGPQLLDPKLVIQGRIKSDFDAELRDLLNLFFDDRARQPKLRDAVIHHSASLVGRFEDGYAITHQGQIMRGRDARRARANDGNLLSARYIRATRLQHRKMPAPLVA